MKVIINILILSFMTLFIIKLFIHKYLANKTGHKVSITSGVDVRAVLPVNFTVDEKFNKHKKIANYCLVIAYILLLLSIILKYLIHI